MDWLHGKLIASTFHSAFVMPSWCLDFHLLLSSTCHELLDLHSLGSPRFSLFFPSLSQSSDQLLLRKQAGDWELPYLPPVNPKPCLHLCLFLPIPSCQVEAVFSQGRIQGGTRALRPSQEPAAHQPARSCTFSLSPRMLSATFSGLPHPRKQTWF